MGVGDKDGDLLLNRLSKKEKRGNRLLVCAHRLENLPERIGRERFEREERGELGLVGAQSVWWSACRCQ